MHLNLVSSGLDSFVLYFDIGDLGLKGVDLFDDVGPNRLGNSAAGEVFFTLNSVIVTRLEDDFGFEGGGAYVFPESYEQVRPEGLDLELNSFFVVLTAYHTFIAGYEKFSILIFEV